MRFLLLLAAPLVYAAKLTVHIPPSGNLLPNPAVLPASSHAILIGPPGIRHDAPLRRDTSFVFDDVTPASYLLTIHSHEIAFPPLRVDVQSTEDGKQELVSAWQTFRGNEWSNKGPHFGTATGELSVHVRPVAQKEFYQARGGFNLLSFLKSPMILMALVSVAMIFGMPYLLENMDPETKAEFEEMQRKSPLSGGQGAASQIQNFDLAGFLSGKSGDAQAQPQAQDTVRRR